MIEKANFIETPISGEFEERIYDVENVWNSQNWAYIKFENIDYSEWCGVFRGSYKGVSISPSEDKVMVLTSDYLYLLDRNSGDLIEYEFFSQYIDLALSPSGYFILTDYYNIFKIKNNLTEREQVYSPIEMVDIKFLHWENSKLLFSCEEFGNWDRHLLMSYDYIADKIEIVDG